MLAQGDHHHQQMIKGKRTKRPRPVSPVRDTTSSSSITTTLVESGSHHNSPAPLTTPEEEDLANCLILLAQGRNKFQNYPPHPRPHPHQLESSPSYVYECKTCDRSFPSFQALGGHRAGHKRPKPLCESEDHQVAESNKIIINSNNNNNIKEAKAPILTTKVHACGVCGAEFSSGQALGGHMRRHRTPAPAIQSPSPEQIPARAVHLFLDLNLPAEEQQHQESHPQIPQSLIFTNSLVDCRY